MLSSCLHLRSNLKPSNSVMQSEMEPEPSPTPARISVISPVKNTRSSSKCESCEVYKKKSANHATAPACHAEGEATNNPP